MKTSDPNVWEALLIICMTVVVIFVALYAICAFVTWLERSRDSLRDRYLGGGWRPHVLDLLGLPSWIALEITLVIGAILVAVLTLWMIYDTARSARDWWHAGEKRRR